MLVAGLLLGAVVLAFAGRPGLEAPYPAACRRPAWKHLAGVGALSSWPADRTVCCAVLGTPTERNTARRRRTLPFSRAAIGRLVSRTGGDSSSQLILPRDGPGAGAVPELASHLASFQAGKPLRLRW